MDQKEFLKLIVYQNHMTTSYSLNKVNDETANLRLTTNAASIGFIYRHIGETINLFCQFFGVPTDVKNTTIGEIDEGQGKDIKYSHHLIEEGFTKLYKLLETQSDEYWYGDVETPFFGTIPRIRLLAHILFHTSHHAGQISLALARGSN